MKSRLTIFLTALLFSVKAFSQTSWVTTANLQFSSAGDSWDTKSSCGSDYTVTNTYNDTLLIAVDHQCSDSSVISFDFSSKGIILNNKYAEFRIKGQSAFQSNLVVKTKDGDSIAFPFYYKKPGKWQILFFNMDSLMNANGFPDSIDKEISFWLPDGSYKIDYFLMGDYSIPPIPMVDGIKPQHLIMGYCGDFPIVKITATNIKIPNRYSIEELTIEVNTYNDGIISDLRLIPYENGELVNSTTNTAIIEFSIYKGMGYLPDSIYIILKDTLRHTKNISSFYVIGEDCICDPPPPWFSCNTNNNTLFFETIRIYQQSNTLFIDSNENINAKMEVFSISGSVLINQNISNQSHFNINIDYFPSGLYLVKISDGKNVFVRKIVKE